MFLLLLAWKAAMRAPFLASCCWMAELREACAMRPEAILVLGAAKAVVCRSRAERAIDAMLMSRIPGYQLNVSLRLWLFCFGRGRC